MKHRILGAIFALTVALGISVGNPTVPSAFAADCVQRQSSDTHRFTAYGRWVDATVNMNYRHCVGVNGNRWVDPISYRAAYNMEGTSYNCAWFTWFNGVRFNLYLWDGRGHNYNPGPIEAPCKENTHWENVYSLTNSPNFKYCFGVPKWKSSTDLMIYAEPDEHATLQGPMWGFEGPVANDC